MRKGIVFTRPRDTISFFVGVVLGAFGIIPLLVNIGLLGWTLPGFIQNLPFEVAIWIIAIFGLYVTVDGFIEPPAHNLHWILIVLGIVLFVVGLLPILHNYGIIGLSFGFLDNLILYQGIISLEGILLIVGGLTEH